MIRSVYLLASLTWLLGYTPLLAQIGISGPPHPSAALDLQSPANDKVFYPPRLSTIQRLAVINPQAGALVYDTDKGTLYLYDGQHWLPLLTTPNTPYLSRTASDGVAGDSFGSSVSISGDYAVVGSPHKDIGSNSQQGATYVFGRSGNTWNQQQELTASDGATNNYFGTSVSISGNYLIVGAPNKSIGSNNQQGAAYVFGRSGNTWTQKFKLVANDGMTGDGFGSSVAMSGNYAIVGSPNKTIGSNSHQGAAYIFFLSDTLSQRRLTASDGSINGFFGTSVSISGDYAVVGSPNKFTSSNSGDGVAYVFGRSGNSWNQQQELMADDEAEGDHFGSSVSISGNYLIVGSPGKTIGSNNQQGAAYVFIRSDSNTWIQQQRDIDNSPALTRNGCSVGLSNGSYVIGGNSYQTNQGKVGFGSVN